MAYYTNKRYYVLISLSLVIALVLTIVAIVLVATKDQNSVTPLGLVEVRKETPTLGIYETLPENTTIEELKAAVRKSNNNATVTLYQDGHGTISIRGEEDAITFTHDVVVEDGESQDDLDLNDVLVDKRSITEINDYEPTATISDFIYLYYVGETGYAIDFLEEEGSYEVTDMLEGYQFPTKKEAIEAYLDPVVQD